MISFSSGLQMAVVGFFQDQIHERLMLEVYFPKLLKFSFQNICEYDQSIARFPRRGWITKYFWGLLGYAYYFKKEK